MTIASRHQQQLQHAQGRCWSWQNDRQAPGIRRICLYLMLHMKPAAPLILTPQLTELGFFLQTPWQAVANQLLKKGQCSWALAQAKREDK